MFFLLLPNYIAMLFMQNLQGMKIGTQHRNKMWRSLVEMRNGANLSPRPETLHASASTASTVSSSAFAANPGFYEVTRYTFKHTISLKNEGDHDYC